MTADLLYAKIAQASYGSGEVPGFQLAGRFSNDASGTQGVFGQDSEAFIIAFRGTEVSDLKDFITDILAHKQEFPYAGDEKKNIRVHSGFIGAYRSVRDAVLKMATESTNTKIVVTGHSLGGALATLAALDIQYNLPDRQVESWTFGSPRVGNEEFVAAYNRRVKATHRYVNGNDPIVKVPTIYYKHVVEAILLPGGFGFDHGKQYYVKNLGGDVVSISTKIKDLWILIKAKIKGLGSF